jgi:hypothetical protein
MLSVIAGSRVRVRSDGRLGEVEFQLADIVFAHNNNVTSDREGALESDFAGSYGEAGERAKWRARFDVIRNKPNTARRKLQGVLCPVCSQDVIDWNGEEDIGGNLSRDFDLPFDPIEIEPEQFAQSVSERP